MSNKVEAFDFFKHFKAKVENQKENKIKILCTDRDGESFQMNFHLPMQSMV